MKLLIIDAHQIHGSTVDAVLSKGSGFDDIINMPPDIASLWKHIPCELNSLTEYLRPVYLWILSESRTGDHVHINGDPVACTTLAIWAFEHGRYPVCAMLEPKITREDYSENGFILKQEWQHVGFRPYAPALLAAY